MTPVIFDVDMDAVGSRNPITLPIADVGGQRYLRIRPPLGHQWTFYGQAAGGVGYPLDVDQEYVLERPMGQAPFSPGETVGWTDLDTGAGTGSASLS